MPVLRALAFVLLMALLCAAAGVAALAVIGPALLTIDNRTAAFALTVVAVVGPVLVIGSALGAVLLRALLPRTRTWGLRRRAGICALAIALASVAWAAMIYTGFATVLEATVLTSPAAAILVLLLSRRAGG